jgi:hypothetical protein
MEQYKKAFIMPIEGTDKRNKTVAKVQRIIKKMESDVGSMAQIDNRLMLEVLMGSIH